MCGGRDLHVDLVLRAEARELVLVDRLQHRERLIRALDAHGHAAHVVHHLEGPRAVELGVIARIRIRLLCLVRLACLGNKARDAHVRSITHAVRNITHACQAHHTHRQEHHTCVSGASHTHVGSITHSPVSATKPVMPIPSLWSYMLPMPSAPPTPSPPAAAPDDAADPTGTVSPTCICPGERHRDTSVTSIETPRLRIQRHLSD